MCVAVEKVSVKTPGNKTFASLQHAIMDRTEMVFFVKAASHAYIALTAIHGVISVEAYELGIGVQGNTKTELKVLHQLYDPQHKLTSTVGS